MTTLASAEVSPAQDITVVPLHRTLITTMEAGHVFAAAWLATLCANIFGEYGIRVSADCAVDIGSLFVVWPPESTTAAIGYVDLAVCFHGANFTPELARSVARRLFGAIGKGKRGQDRLDDSFTKLDLLQKYSPLAPVRDTKEGHSR